MTFRHQPFGWYAWLGVSLLFVSASPSAQAQTCGETWSQIYYDTTGAYGIRSMASNGSMHVAVGDCDKVDIDSDGTKEDPGECVAHGGGGLILTSTDLATWTHRYQPFCSWGIHGITYGNGKFVAVGNMRRIGTSPDGVTWTARATALAAEGYFYEVIYSGSLFVAVGANGNGYAAVFTSSDGITWTERPQGVCPAFNCVALGKDQNNNNLLVAVGNAGFLRTSPDGITWTTRTVPTTQYLESVDYGNGLFVVGAKAGVVLTSSNGINWTLQNLGENRIIFEITYAGSVFVASVEGLSATNCPVFTSPYGDVWTKYTTTGFEGRHHYGGYWDGSKAFLTGHRTIRSSECPPAPLITQDPSSQTVCANTSVQFCVTAACAEPFNYQWQKYTGSSWTNITSAQSACYTINPVNASHAGQYRCRVWNTYGEDFSNSATLGVRIAPSTFSQQPTSQNLCEWSSVKFCATASNGSSPLYYQWQRYTGSSWTGISGAQADCYAIDSVHPVDAGQYRCQVSNDCGSTTSSVATLTVTARVIADLDCDGDVDQEDFGQFQACLSGEGVEQTDPACEDAMLDADNDVGESDFAIFLGCMRGPNNPPGC